MSKTLPAIIIDSSYGWPVRDMTMIVNAEKVIIEERANYQKGSYQNRMELAGPNGRHAISVPVRKGRRVYFDQEIAYDEPWQHIHWQTLCSNYRRSPYFEFYEDELEPMFTKTWDKLADLSREILNFACEAIGFSPVLEFTRTFKKEHEDVLDLRDLKGRGVYKLPDAINYKNRSYTQVFGDRHGYLEELSILDMLFNLGPGSLDHLKDQLN